MHKMDKLYRYTHAIRAQDCKKSKVKYWIVWLSSVPLCTAWKLRAATITFQTAQTISLVLTYQTGSLWAYLPDYLNKKRIIPSCTSLLSVLFYWDFCWESVGMHPLVIRAWKIQLFNLNRGLTKGRGTNSRPRPLTLCRCFFFNCVPRIEFLKERI